MAKGAIGISQEGGSRGGNVMGNGGGNVGNGTRYGSCMDNVSSVISENSGVGMELVGHQVGSWHGSDELWASDLLDDGRGCGGVFDNRGSCGAGKRDGWRAGFAYSFENKAHLLLPVKYRETISKFEFFLILSR